MPIQRVQNDLHHVVATAQILSGGLESGAGFKSTESVLVDFSHNPLTEWLAELTPANAVVSDVAPLLPGTSAVVSSNAPAAAGPMTTQASAVPDVGLDLGGLFTPQLGNTLRILSIETAQELTNGLLESFSLDVNAVNQSSVESDATPAVSTAESEFNLLNFLQEAVEAASSVQTPVEPPLQVVDDMLVLSVGGGFSPVSAKVSVGQSALISDIELARLAA